MSSWWLQDGCWVLCLPAVDHCRPRTRTSIDIVPDSADKLNEGLRSFRDAMVGPHGVVELANQPREIQLFLLTHKHRHAHTWKHTWELFCVYWSLLKRQQCASVPIYTADVELSYGPFRQDRLWQHLDNQVPVVQGVLVKGPVVITLHLYGQTDRHTDTHTRAHRENTEDTFELPDFCLFSKVELQRTLLNLSYI